MQRIARALAPALMGLILLPAATTAASGNDSDPLLELSDPTGLTSTGVTLNGKLTTGVLGTDYRYQYGTGNTFGSYTPLRSAGALALLTPAETLSGLQPATTYRYRLVASRSGSGSGKTFTSVTKYFTTAAGAALPTGTTTLPGAATLPDSSGSKNDPAPVPESKKDVGVAPTSGTVTVKQADGSYAPLKQGDTIPAGSVIDSRRGTVALTSKLPSGRTQTGYFRGGVFKVGYSKGGYVDLYLRGELSCGARRARAAAASAGMASTSAARKGRRLFGRDKGGRFRTHGRHSHATVRGTRWVVEDRCGSTVTKVSEGAVAVRDLAKRRTVLVKAGGRYVARARGR